MFEPSNFKLNDSVYKDDVQTHPAHYNSMRAKPIDPVGSIECNISTVKPFPNNYTRSVNEWQYCSRDKQLRKRCLFNFDESNQQIHLASIEL